MRWSDIQAPVEAPGKRAVSEADQAPPGRQVLHSEIAVKPVGKAVGGFGW